MIDLIRAKDNSRIDICVKNNKISLINKNLIEVIGYGDVNDEDALLMKEASLNLLEEASYDVAVLIDLNKAGKSSPKARKIWKELSEYNKNRKFAFIGLTPLTRILATFVIAFSENKNMKFFASREEALKWLGVA